MATTDERDAELHKRLRGYRLVDADDLAALLNENDSLRAALNKIAARTGSDDPCRWMVQLARNALL